MQSNCCTKAMMSLSLDVVFLFLQWMIIQVRHWVDNMLSIYGQLQRRPMDRVSIHFLIIQGSKAVAGLSTLSSLVYIFGGQEPWKANLDLLIRGPPIFWFTSSLHRFPMVDSPENLSANSHETKRKAKGPTKIPIGSMVLVYMLTWLWYIDGIHVTI